MRLYVNAEIPTAVCGACSFFFVLLNASYICYKFSKNSFLTLQITMPVKYFPLVKLVKPNKSASVANVQLINLIY